MKRKNGITISALVLYITLLSAFVVIATAVSKNVEMSIFEQKALSISMENYSRIATSLNVSASNSDEVIVTDNAITFYKGPLVVDSYTFDKDNKILYKNDVFVTTDLDNFSITQTNMESQKKLEVELQLTKYSKSITRDIVVCVEKDSSISNVRDNVLVSIDKVAGMFINESSTSAHVITVTNNNSFAIKYSVTGNSTTELSLSGTGNEVSVPANSSVTTTITVAPIGDYIDSSAKSYVDVSVNILSPFEYTLAIFNLEMSTLAAIKDNVLVSIDSIAGEIADESSTSEHTLTITNNNAFAIKYSVSGDAGGELNLSGLANQVNVPANSSVTTTVTISPIENYIYTYEKNYVDVVVKVSDPFEFEAAKYTLEISTYGTLLKEIIIANQDIDKTTPEFTQNATSTANSGVFSTNDATTATDSTKKAYFFRGVVSDNYLSFANHMWRVLRVNGDGTIRLVLNSPIGTTSTYTYSSSATNTVYNGSSVESTLESWYASNLLNYNSYINQAAVFIHDRGSYSTNPAVFQGWYRVYAGAPLIDTTKFNSAYLYSVAGGQLKYPIGLLTSDEIMMAGAVKTTGSTDTSPNSASTSYQANHAYFLANDVPAGVGLWTMTPFSPTAVMVFKSHVGFYKETSASARLLKPVIELKASLEFKGTGTQDDPYKIVN